MQKRYLENINRYELSTDSNHILHRVNNKDYPKIRKVFVKVEDIINYEEIAILDIPVYTKVEYDNKVAQFVRERYSESEEFAIQRKMLNITLNPTLFSDVIDSTAKAKVIEEYQAYNLYVEQCKAKAAKVLIEEKSL